MKIDRSAILNYLPQIVTEHTAMLQHAAIRCVVNEKAAFWIDLYVPKKLSLQLSREEIADIFDLYVLECERQQAQDTAVVISLCPNVGQTGKLRNEFRYLSLPRLLAVLNILATRRQWSLLMDIIQTLPDIRPHSLLRQLVLDCVVDNPQVEKCIELLIPQCTDSFLLGKIAQRFIEGGRCSSFSKLLSLRNVNPAQWWSHNGKDIPVSLLGLAADKMAKDTKICTGSSPNIQIVIQLIEGGLSTQQHHHEDYNKLALQDIPTPLVLSAFHDMPDLVLLFYKTGAVTNEELYLLSRHERFLKSVDNVNDSSPKQRVVDFIRTETSRPRSLRDLCVLVVSRCLGCGYERDSRACRLPINRLTRDAILFKNVLDDFQRLHRLT